jgi:hypothetical protein
MNSCWVLVVTRGLSVWLPPEVYLQRSLAERESKRWRTTLRLPTVQPRWSQRARYLHLVTTEFPDSWRACPVWFGMSWSLKTYPRFRSELMAADEEEAALWLRRRTPKGHSLPGMQIEFDRRGVRTSVGVFRVKRVMGF